MSELASESSVLRDGMSGDWSVLVVEAAAECTSVLARAADRDWSRAAAGLEWTCRETLDHLALGIVGYAGLLIAQPADRYIALFASLDPHAPVAACLEGIRIAGTVLASAVRDAAPGARAWHPWGRSDGPGFAAMGIVELMVHTRDIAGAFAIDWTPPHRLCRPALERLFPEAPTGHDAAATLMWCTGRAALPGHARRRQWQWDGSPRAAGAVA